MMIFMHVTKQMYAKVILVSSRELHIWHKFLLLCQILIGEYTVLLTACHLSYKMEGSPKKILIDFVALYSLNDIDNIVGEVYQEVVINFYYPGISDDQPDEDCTDHNVSYLTFQSQYYQRMVAKVWGVTFILTCSAALLMTYFQQYDDDPLAKKGLRY